MNVFGSQFGFSPVAGIQWVETSTALVVPPVGGGVSVPLPGFSGLRLQQSIGDGVERHRFSPVAGIQWVETLAFQFDDLLLTDVSVPLPGFSGLRHSGAWALFTLGSVFQSRCRDSVG